MLSWLFKKAAVTPEAQPVTLAKLSEIAPHFPDREGFCHPDWNAIGNFIETSFPKSDWQQVWVQVVQLWLEKIRDQLAGSYKLYETPNFFILSAGEQDAIDATHKLCETSLKIILKSLPGVAMAEGYGKRVVILFSTQDEYYSYISGFYPEGEHPMSGGICLSNEGYVHFAMPAFDNYSYGAVLVHELAHSCVAHLPLPLWLNEAIAMRMEEIAGYRQHPELDKESYQKHLRHWTAETIQLFWNGQSWSSPGDGFDLSYDLARILWKKIEIDQVASHQSILKFLSSADHKDAGRSACQATFNLTLEDLIEDFLGKGSWKPKPETWKNPAE